MNLDQIVTIVFYKNLVKFLIHIDFCHYFIVLF